MKTLLNISLILILLSACNKNTAKTTQAETTTSANTDNTQKPDNTQVKAEEPKPVETAKEKDEIKWMSYDDAVKLAKKKPKKIFIDVYTDWCGWCKKMDKTTFKDPKIAEYMNKKYYAVKLNAESDKMVSFQGKQMTETQLASKVFKISGYPSTVYLEADEKIIQPVPGYMDVPTMDKILHYVGEDAFKTQSWEQYQMSYKGE